MDEIVVYSIMNKPQKIFIMVAVGSIILWFITVFALGFDGERYVSEHGFTAVPVSDFREYFKVGKRTNWLGIIAIF
ncbi:MAG: hypothetical protein QF439_02715, partial [Candidatus Marinimicrobia bacterium]|nr:hypothetical protein [Candidatus Neomarinimicrobiota bacterium]